VCVRFCGSRAILSGPAGGVVGYAQTTVLDDSANAVIGFDMGGMERWMTFNVFTVHFLYSCLLLWAFSYEIQCLPTGTSTDVSRYAGSLEHVFESTTAGITIQAPQVRLLVVSCAHLTKS
jgi:5-oxoprolinase (ATP-hydrolysing)